MSRIKHSLCRTCSCWCCITTPESCAAIGSVQWLQVAFTGTEQRAATLLVPQLPKYFIRPMYRSSAALYKRPKRAGMLGYYSNTVHRRLDNGNHAMGSIGVSACSCVQSCGTRAERRPAAHRSVAMVARYDLDHLVSVAVKRRHAGMVLR